MIRLALFVEGQTETIFFQYLLREYFGAANVHIRTFVAWGGGAAAERQAKLVFTDGMTHAPVHVLIRDCTGEAKVITELRDHFGRLSDSGFSLIVAVTDLHPNPLARADAIRAARSAAVSGLDTLQCRAASVLSVHEAEAFFVLDRGHFALVCSHPDEAVVSDVLGTPEYIRDVETIASPASKLEEIYRRNGSKYDKSEEVLRQIASALDFVFLFVEGRMRSRALDHFFGLLEDAIQRSGGWAASMKCEPA